MSVQSIKDSLKLIMQTLSSPNPDELESEALKPLMSVDHPQEIRKIATTVASLIDKFHTQEKQHAAIIEELQKARKKLSDFDALLDDKVKERTKSLQQANTLLEAISITDPLTKISNRRHFDDQFRKEFSRARRHKTLLTCVLLDIDHFKKVNDTYGHLAGDEVLKRLGALLTKNLRDHDIFARYGGEEFIILLPETNVQAAYYVAEKLREIVANETVNYNNIKIKITISLGIAAYNIEEMKTREELIAATDDALYQAKEEGRNRSVIFRG